MKLITQFLVVNWLVFVAKCRNQTISYSKQLLTDLFTDYDTRLRPVVYEDDTVLVSINFHLTMLRALDDVTGELIFLGKFEMDWTDVQLTWQPHLYSGLDEITVPKINIWNPELFMPSSLNTNSQPGSAGTKVSISSNGRVKAKSVDLLTSYCSVDVTDFPYDYQTCAIEVFTNGYNSQQIKLFPLSSNASFNNDNSQWEILRVETRELLASLLIKIDLKRRNTYADVTMVVPILLLAVLNLWVFILPPESGERISYSITSFLSFTVYMGILTGNMPKGSMPLANVMYMVFVLLIYSVAILLCTIISLKLYHNAGKKPAPPLIKKVIKFFTFAFFRRIHSNVTKIHVSSGKTVENLNERKHQTNPDITTQLPDTITESMADDSDVTWIKVSSVFDKCMLFVFCIWLISLTCIYMI